MGGTDDEVREDSGLSRVELRMTVVRRRGMTRLTRAGRPRMRHSNGVTRPTKCQFSSNFM